MASVMGWAVEAVADHVENIRPRLNETDAHLATARGLAAHAETRADA